MLEFDPDMVKRNAQEATTQDLLDRITVYRDGMEPEALEIIEQELRRQGVKLQDVEDHEQRIRQSVLRDASGVALRCSFCDAPAVAENWGWHRVGGWLPIFPRLLRYCEEHNPIK
jgi:hypothetical protein